MPTATAATSSRFKLIPLSRLLKAGCACAWADCPRNFNGPMPTGWTWLQVYWSPQVGADPLKRDWMRDGVLCPEHTLKLDALMKHIPRVAE
jgi:hypothetical protein